MSIVGGREPAGVGEDAGDAANGTRPPELVTARERSELRRGWSTRLPLALVVVSLASLAVVPFLVERRGDALRDEVETTVEPARRRINEIQSSLALEVAGARGFLLTGDQEFAARYREARVRRRQAEARFLLLAQRLGPGVSAEALALIEERRSADPLLDSLFHGRLSRQEYQTRLGEQQARLEAAVARTSRVDEMLRGVAAARRTQVRATERLGVALTVLLVLLALVAALLVARLGRGYRSLALRLDESEASFRQIAERERAAREEAEEARATAERRRSELERVTESRARLIRGFTHDVKNPLGAADGFLALLEDGVLGDLAPPQKQSVGKVRRSIRSALDLIRQLLDLAQAEAGQLKIRCVAMDMRAVARDVVEEFRAQAQAAGLALEFELPERVPVFETDPERARQVLANLISNAIKYTPGGGRVTVRVATRSGGSAPGPGEWVVAEVSDTGRGIPPDKQRLLFLEFTRFDPGAAQGAGIGLAISQRIAHALGGAITVESEVGAGSTFTLWLPLVPIGAEEVHEAAGSAG
jgi:signal transduction histidine kinase